MSTGSGFSPKKRLAQVYFGIPGESFSWVESNSPELNELMIPAIKKAKEVFEREHRKAELAAKCQQQDA